MNNQNNKLPTDFLNNLPKGLKYSVAIVIQIAILVLNRSHVDISDYSAIKPNTLSFDLRKIYIAEMWADLIARSTVELLLSFALGYSLWHMVNHIKKDT